MAATTRTNECSAAAVTLYLAFELGSTKWTLGFTLAPAQRPRLRAIAAGVWARSSGSVSPPSGALPAVGRADPELL
jgi:hypothetical protein